MQAVEYSGVSPLELEADEEVGDGSPSSSPPEDASVDAPPSEEGEGWTVQIRCSDCGLLFECGESGLQVAQPICCDVRPQFLAQCTECATVSAPFFVPIEVENRVYPVRDRQPPPCLSFYSRVPILSSIAPGDVSPILALVLISVFCMVSSFVMFGFLPASQNVDDSAALIVTGVFLLMFSMAGFVGSMILFMRARARIRAAYEIV